MNVILDCVHRSQTPDAKYSIHMCVHCFSEFFIGCQHERDKNEAPILSHFTAQEGCVFVVKCLKCGEFYR